MKPNKALYIALMVLGIAILLVGIFVFQGEVFKAYTGVFSGFGAAMATVSITRLVTINKMQTDPAFKRQVEIDAKDERTARVNDLARSRAFAITQILYAVLAMVLIFIGTDLLRVSLVIVTFIIGWVIYFVYLGKYAKEM